MIDYFPQVIEYILNTEGGFVNDPSDSGGATNYGITQATLIYWHDGQPLTADDVKNLSRDEAIKIYRSLYWEKNHLDQIKSFEIAYLLMDQIVNRGSKAIKNAQVILKMPKIDGIVGPETIAALNGTEGNFNFVLPFSHMAELEYLNIVARHPEKIKFLPNWLIRVHNAVMICWNYDGQS